MVALLARRGAHVKSRQKGAVSHVAGAGVHRTAAGVDETLFGSGDRLWRHAVALRAGTGRTVTIRTTVQEQPELAQTSLQVVARPPAITILRSDAAGLWRRRQAAQIKFGLLLRRAVTALVLPINVNRSQIV